MGGEEVSQLQLDLSQKIVSKYDFTRVKVSDVLVLCAQNSTDVYRANLLNIIMQSR